MEKFKAFKIWDKLTMTECSPILYIKETESYYNGCNEQLFNEAAGTHDRSKKSNKTTKQFPVKQKNSHKDTTDKTI